MKKGDAKFHRNIYKKANHPKTMARIITDPKICHGKPTIEGTRIMVANVLSLFAGGYNAEQIKGYYPELTLEDIRESIQYAVKAVQEEEILLQ